ncbi:MAG TPA: glycosyltransferase [Blastocatellia bacterium]|nr:glycosyltransferase [Blastocatellia bacterium]
MRTGVSIVIPSWNGLDLLKRYLPSVIAAASHYREYAGARVEVIVVDDASTDATSDWLTARGFDGSAAAGALSATANGLVFRLIRSSENRGFGDACNRGVAAAEHPLVFLLNNDVEPDVGSIRPLAENFADPSVFAVHCRVFEVESGRECGTGKVGGFSRGFIRVHQSYRPKASSNGAGEVQSAAEAGFYSMFAGGGSAMFDREKFLGLGGFEPLLSPFYWEDVELSYRAWKRGYTVLYEPRSITHHRVSSTIGKFRRGPVRRIEQRNRLLFHWINLHDAGLMQSHLRWLIVLALTAPFRLRPRFVASCLAAMKMLRRVRERRREEQRAAVRDDRQIMAMFDDLKRRSDLHVFDG